MPDMANHTSLQGAATWWI